uniref:Uncharacterized protein n=1 Tax=Paramoeba aestuarina TaxID=180227 RepID=A0A7S4KYU4_9EUKA
MPFTLSVYLPQCGSQMSTADIPSPSDDHETQILLDSSQFEIDRLDFESNRITVSSYRSKLDACAGLVSFTLIAVHTKRVWHKFQPIDSILYRNRFLVPKLPDWAAKITNPAPVLFSPAAGYSLWMGLSGANDWRKTRKELRRIGQQIEEKRELVKNLKGNVREEQKVETLGQSDV